jgi:hypothetical protein
MKFVHRFAYYLVGLVIGCFVALVLVAKIPVVVISPMRVPMIFVINHLSTLIKLHKYWPNLGSIKDIKQSLTFGDVDFDKSSTEFSKNTVYIIGKEKQQKNIDIILTVEIKQVKQF